AGGWGAEAGDLRREHRARDGMARLPAVADLPRQVGLVAALAPVPFVRLQAGLELTAEQPLEAGRHSRGLVRIDEAVEDEEALLVKAGNLGGAQFDHGPGDVACRIWRPPS